MPGISFLKSDVVHHRAEAESIKVLDLESENKRLKNELTDIKETVDILKRVIDDYAHK